MEVSPNQYTRPMSHIHDTFWNRLDRQLLEDEVELAREKEWLSDAREASLTELDEYLATLPIEEHEAAIQGLKAYEAEVRDRPIIQGWCKLTQ